MLILFSDARRKSTHELKIKIDGNKLIPSKCVECMPYCTVL